MDECLAESGLFPRFQCFSDESRPSSDDCVLPEMDENVFLKWFKYAIDVRGRGSELPCLST